METQDPLHKIPVPSTDFVVEAHMHPSSDGDMIRFSYAREDVEYRSGIRFRNVCATRSRAERCCTVWHIDSAYDTLVEVLGSSWVKELLLDMDERWRNRWETHHYMVYLDSAGCFEVVADSWEALQEEVGSWQQD